jgi:hypothetical protein
MGVVTKRTSELSPDEVLGICSLFGKVFEKEMTAPDFAEKFGQAGSTREGSFHSLSIENGTVVGAYSCIPQRFRYFEKDLVFGLSVDTMIDPDHRGGGRLKRLAETTYAALKDAGIPFVYGFPNDNIYLVRQKLLRWNDIAKLDYFLLPIRIGAVIRPLRFLSPLSAVACRRLLPRRYEVSAGAGRPIEKANDDAFRSWRYRSRRYRTVQRSWGWFAYSVFDEDGIATGYVVDVSPLSASAIANAAGELLTLESRLDVILYIGKLAERPRNLIGVPLKFQPKTVHMSGRILDANVVDERVFDVRHWNVNLSNFDVR